MGAFLRVGAVGDDVTGAELDDPVGHARDLPIVGDDEHGLASVGLRLEQFEDLDAGTEIELSGRFVGEQDRIACRERACDRDPLLLAAGELVREVAHPVGEADLFEDARGDVVVATARDLGAELHVLQRGQTREEVETLEDEAHRFPPQAEPFLRDAAREIDPVEGDPALGGSVERADHIEQRGLAAS